MLRGLKGRVGMDELAKRRAAVMPATRLFVQVAEAAGGKVESFCPGRCVIRLDDETAVEVAIRLKNPYAIERDFYLSLGLPVPERVLEGCARWNK